MCIKTHQESHSTYRKTWANLVAYTQTLSLVQAELFYMYVRHYHVCVCPWVTIHVFGHVCEHQTSKAHQCTASSSATNRAMCGCGYRDESLGLGESWVGSPSLCHLGKREEMSLIVQQKTRMVHMEEIPP